MMLVLCTNMMVRVRGEVIKRRWSFLKCQIDCMPMCMRLEDVKISDCKSACLAGCEQLKGRGIVQANGWPIPRAVPIRRP